MNPFPIWRRALASRLQLRIVVVFIGMLLLVQVLSLWLISDRIGASAVETVDRELERGRITLSSVLDRRAEKLVSSLTVLSKDSGVREALVTRDAETINDTLANHGARIGADLGIATDLKFAPLAATRKTGAPITELASALAGRYGEATQQPLALDVSASPDGVKRTVRLTLLDGQLYQLAAVPVFAPQAIGWVVLGYRLDATMLGDFKQLSPNDIVLLAQQAPIQPWTVLASAVGDGMSGPPRPLAAAAAAPLTERWLTLRTKAVTSASPDSASLAHPVPLSLPYGIDAKLGGELRSLEIALTPGRDGVALLVRSLDEARAPFNAAKDLLRYLTLAAVVLFAIGSLLMARRITNPLRALTQAARGLGGGDYATPIAATSEDEIGTLAQAFEVTRQTVQRRDADLQRVAYVDPLTSLPNRAGFAREVTAALQAASVQPQAGACALLMLDLDRFKRVNDALGHNIGDEVLQLVAELLQRELRRPGDRLARLGANQFALLMPGSHAELGVNIAERMTNALRTPITVQDRKVDLSASFGVAAYPEHADNTETLMKRAELALDEAKKLQFGVVVFHAGLDASSAESLSLLSELRQAVTNDELRLFLQPKIDIRTGQVVAAEALVRWKHPSRGMVPPGQFIPFAEQSGFIRELTGWIIERGARRLRLMHSEGLPIRLALNLSARDLIDQDLPERLQRLVADHALVGGAAFLNFEITESAIFDDPERAKATLHRLHEAGFKLSIDDFGEGQTSLRMLKDLPVHELKIDMVFVRKMEFDENDARIVNAITRLAKGLGLRVVAEGVETERTLALLRKYGVDEAQGYFVAKPMPEEEFTEWVRNFTMPSTDAIRVDTRFGALS